MSVQQATAFQSVQVDGIMTTKGRAVFVKVVTFRSVFSPGRAYGMTERLLVTFRKVSLVVQKCRSLAGSLHCPTNSRVLTGFLFSGLYHAARNAA